MGDYLLLLRFRRYSARSEPHVADESPLSAQQLLFRLVKQVRVNRSLRIRAIPRNPWSKTFYSLLIIHFLSFSLYVRKL